MQTIDTLALIVGTIQDHNLDYVQSYAPILAVIIDENHSIESMTSDDIMEALENIESEYSDDFTFEFDGNEYRCIHKDSIWDIYVGTIQDIVDECYDLKLDKLPGFIAVSIDWEQTAQNAYSDGYGHTFSSYDHSEIEPSAGNKHHIFRTN